MRRLSGRSVKQLSMTPITCQSERGCASEKQGQITGQTARGATIALSYQALSAILITRPGSADGKSVIRLKFASDIPGD